MGTILIFPQSTNRMIIQAKNPIHVGSHVIYTTKYSSSSNYR